MVAVRGLAWHLRSFFVIYDGIRPSRWLAKRIYLSIYLLDILLWFWACQANITFVVVYTSQLGYNDCWPENSSPLIYKNSSITCSLDGSEVTVACRLRSFSMGSRADVASC